MRSRRALVVAFSIAVAVAVANAVVLAGGRSEEGAVAGADCALVLGAGVRDDGSPTDVLRDRRRLSSTSASVARRAAVRPSISRATAA